MTASTALEQAPTAPFNAPPIGTYDYLCGLYTDPITNIGERAEIVGGSIRALALRYAHLPGIMDELRPGEIDGGVSVTASTLVTLPIDLIDALQSNTGLPDDALVWMNGNIRTSERPTSFVTINGAGLVSSVVLRLPVSQDESGKQINYTYHIRPGRHIAPSFVFKFQETVEPHSGATERGSYSDDADLIPADLGLLKRYEELLEYQCDKISAQNIVVEDQTTTE